MLGLKKVLRDPEQKGLARLRQARKAEREKWVEAGRAYALEQAEHEELERAAEIEIGGEPHAFGWGAELYFVMNGQFGERSEIAELSKRLLGTAYPPWPRVAAFLDGMAEIFNRV